MSQATAFLHDSEPLHINFDPMVNFKGDAFFTFCQLNDNLRIERNSEGGLTIMPPTGGETGRKNADLSAQLWIWAKKSGGVTFDSSTGFILANGAVRSPDAAWVSKQRYERLAPKDREQFVPLCPDFILELRSKADRLPLLQRKMEEYMTQGCQLAWLIDPYSHEVHVYRPDQAPHILKNPQTLSGEPVMPGFSLGLEEIWS